MSCFLKVTEPEKTDGRLKKSHETLTSMFMVVPKVFVSRGIRSN